MRFYNREEELDVLEKAYSRPGSDLIVVSGRRRVGKTRLIEEFTKSKKAVGVLIVPKGEKQVAKNVEEEIRQKRVMLHRWILSEALWSTFLSIT